MLLLMMTKLSQHDMWWHIMLTLGMARLLLLLGLWVNIIKGERRLRSRQGTWWGCCTKGPWLMAGTSPKQVVFFLCKGIWLTAEGDAECLPWRTAAWTAANSVITTSV